MLRQFNFLRGSMTDKSFKILNDSDSARLKHLLNAAKTSLHVFLVTYADLLQNLNVSKLPWNPIDNQIRYQCRHHGVELTSLLVNHTTANQETDFALLQSFSRIFQLYDTSAIGTSNRQSNITFLVESDDTSISNSTKGLGRVTTPLRSISNLPQKSWRESLQDDNVARGDMGWGQRKLLLVEIEFLTAYSKPGDLVLYVGAAPGDHIPLLAGRYFPHLEFVLYDPTTFLFEPGDLNVKNVKIFNQLFLDADVDLYRTTRDKEDTMGHSPRLLFMSDVRRVQDEEEAVYEDLRLQAAWCTRLRPAAALLKFRPPFGAGSLRYLRGHVVLQPYARKRSTETRLVVTTQPDPRPSAASHSASASACCPHWDSPQPSSPHDMVGTQRGVDDSSPSILAEPTQEIATCSSTDDVEGQQSGGGDGMGMGIGMGIAEEDCMPECLYDQQVYEDRLYYFNTEVRAQSHVHGIEWGWIAPPSSVAEAHATSSKSPPGPVAGVFAKTAPPHTRESLLTMMVALWSIHRVQLLHSCHGAHLNSPVVPHFAVMQCLWPGLG